PRGLSWREDHTRSCAEFPIYPLSPPQSPYNGEFLRAPLPRIGLTPPRGRARMLKDAVDRWTVTDASELYEVPRWGKGYFSVNDRGHIQVHPTKDPGLAIDMKDLIDRLQLRGLDLPILVRFNGILKDRLREINDVFAQAIKDHDYKGRY